MLTQEKTLSQAPQVWDKPTASANIGDYFHVPFMPVMQVVETDVLEGGQVWLLVKPVTGSYSEEWVLEKEAQQQPASEPEAQPQSLAGLAGDSLTCQLQPTKEATTEFEQGCQHGRNDALAGWHPIYKEPATEYAMGYLSGYDCVLHPITQQPEASKSIEWSITRNEKWHWYDVWVGCKWVGRAETDEQAEREAQAYAATDEIRKRQNAKVLAAYAC